MTHSRADRFPPPEPTILEQLQRSGWSIGVTAFAGPRRVVWVVSGSNGENLIRAEGVTEEEAWGRAYEQAREVGMLRSRSSSSNVGLHSFAKGEVAMHRFEGTLSVGEEVILRNVVGIMELHDESAKHYQGSFFVPGNHLAQIQAADLLRLDLTSPSSQSWNIRIGQCDVRGDGTLVLCEFSTQGPPI